MVFAWHSGLYTGGVEEAAQLLLLAHSQAVNDATRLLLLLQAHVGHMWSGCDAAVSAECNVTMCVLLRDSPLVCVSGTS